MIQHLASTDKQSREHGEDAGDPKPEGQLDRAKWLGYLKSKETNAPMINTYLQWCHEHEETAVLVLRRGNGAVVVYRVLPITRALTELARNTIRYHLERARDNRKSEINVVTDIGGEITGLATAKAEELAFRIADAARDPDQTELR